MRGMKLRVGLSYVGRTKQWARGRRLKLVDLTSGRSLLNTLRGSVTTALNSFLSASAAKSPNTELEWLFKTAL